MARQALGPGVTRNALSGKKGVKSKRGKCTTKRSRQICTLALSAAVALSCAPLSALAAGAAPAQEENCAVVQQAVSGVWDRLCQALGLSAPPIRASSTLYGSADTGNKSTLKQLLKKTSGPGDQNIYYYNEDGVRVTYPDGVEIQVAPGSLRLTAHAALVLQRRSGDPAAHARLLPPPPRPWRTAPGTPSSAFWPRSGWMRTAASGRG